MKHKQAPELYYQMLLELQAVDFALVELTLYLDTHPTDKQAMAQHAQLAEKRQGLVAEFEAKFGPLTATSPRQTGGLWRYDESPWPWEV